MSRIYHILKRRDWDTAQSKAEYRADSLKSEGFIHCSTAEQLPRSANRYFAGQSDLIVLEIDPSQVSAPIVWEPPPSSEERFPHIYGALNLDAVSGTHALRVDQDGRFASLALSEER